MKYYISMHHSAPPTTKDECFCFYDQYEKFCKLLSRQRLIRYIANVVGMVVLGVIMVLRAYVFLEYGI